MAKANRKVESHTNPLRGAAKKEAYHRSREALVKGFGFKRPSTIDINRKAFVDLAGDDFTEAAVQIINSGGDNNLHYHPNMNSVFFVLKGHIRVYGPGDELVKDCGVNEGVFMPADARYWFEVSGGEEAWLLHVSTYPKGRKMTKRVDVAKNKRDGQRAVHYDCDTLQVVEGPKRN
jgi:mannose-6-phosphate isomerase-like protein (cupin superfamily)